MSSSYKCAEIHTCKHILAHKSTHIHKHPQKLLSLNIQETWPHTITLSHTWAHIHTKRYYCENNRQQTHTEAHTNTHRNPYTQMSRNAQQNNTHILIYTHTHTSKPRMDGEVTAAFHKLSATGGGSGFSFCLQDS